MSRRSVLIVTLLSLALADLAWACCMVPRDFRGRISQKAQEAVIIHHDGRQELILGIDYSIAGDTMPSQFAWIVTVPTEPDAYAVAERAIFDDMRSLARRLAPKRDSRGTRNWMPMAANAAAGGVELGRRVQVGPYDIQPVRARGVEALDGLNAWLDEHGFPTEDPDHMRYFVENGFTFLCIRVQPEEGKATVGEGGPLPPLHLSFDSDEIYYPLRFSSRQGVFDVRLHVFTTVPFDYTRNAAMLDRIRWTNRAYSRNFHMTGDLVPDTLAEAYDKGRIDAPDAQWMYNYIEGQDVNEGDTIAGWADDIFFKPAVLTP